jgi:uncharacterized protein involved in outer membrane biogenesis
MRLSLLPFGVQVEDAVIWEDPAFQIGRPFAEAKTLYVQPKLLPLIVGDIEIDSLRLSSPELELVRNHEGTWNFMSIAAPEKADGRSLSIDELRIDNGRVAITDLRENEPRAVYDRISLALENYAPDKKFSIEVQVHMPGVSEQTIAVEGDAGPIRQSSILNTPFEGRLALNEVSIIGLQRFLHVEALADSDALITGNAEADNDNGTFTSNGTLKASDVRIRGVDLRYPITATYDISRQFVEKKIQIKSADLNLGNTPISIGGTVDAAPSPMVVDVHIMADGASISEASRLAAALGIGFGTDTKLDGTMDLTVHAFGSATKPAMDGKLVASDVRISGASLRQPVQTAVVTLSLSPDVIRSNEFVVATGRTRMTAQFSLSNYVNDAPQVHATINTVDADIGELLNIARAYGTSGADGVAGSGKANLNLTVTGPIKQTSKLIYDGRGRVENATFDLQSLSKPVGLRNATIQFSGNSIVFRDLELSLGQTIARGDLTARNLAAPRVEFSLAANKIDVHEWQALMRPKQKQDTGKGHFSGSFVRGVSGSGDLVVDNVVYDELNLSDCRSKVRLDKGLITLSPLRSVLYGGTQSGTIVVNARVDPPTFSVDTEIQRVDANQLLSSISPLEDAVYGVLSANTNARFVSSGGARGIARSLNGNVSLNVANGAIANMDLFHRIAAIAQFAGTAKPVQPATKVFQLTGAFNIANGVAHTDNLTAGIEEGSLAASGTVDLAQQSLNLHVVAVLSQDYSELVGGTGIGGFMTTALANSKGELVIPFIITGTFQEPNFVPDLQKVAQMKLKQLVPTADNPAQFTLGILKKILRDSRSETAPQQQTPEQKQPEMKEPNTRLPDIFNRILGNIDDKAKSPQ